MQETASDIMSQVSALLWRDLYGAEYTYSKSSSDAVTQKAAEKEIVDLSVNDRLVRKALQQCAVDEFDINAFPSTVEFRLYMDKLTVYSVEASEAHDRWSEFLAFRGFIIRDGDSVERCRAALIATFR